MFYIYYQMILLVQNSDISLRNFNHSDSNNSDLPNDESFILQFMTEMKETAFIMQNVSERYMNCKTLFWFSFMRCLGGWFFIDSLWWTQESDCDGWTGESNIFFWWFCNCMELLWTSTITKSVTPRPHSYLLAELKCESRVLKFWICCKWLVTFTRGGKHLGDDKSPLHRSDI